MEGLARHLILGVVVIRDLYIQGLKRLRVREFIQSFFTYCQKINTPEFIIILFSPRKVGQGSLILAALSFHEPYQLLAVDHEHNR